VHDLSKNFSSTFIRIFYSGKGVSHWNQTSQGKKSILRFLVFAIVFFFFLVRRGGVRLSPLGTSATNWLIVPAPDDR
jgi:hypothetical protein